MSFFDDQELTLECLKCGHKFPETVARLKTSPDISCPSCGTVTHYDAEQFRQGLADADAAIDSLKDTIKKFGKP